MRSSCTSRFKGDKTDSSSTAKGGHPNTEQLAGKRIYLDIKNNATSKNLETSFRSLRACIEVFLVEQVDLVVTDRREWVSGTSGSLGAERCTQTASIKSVNRRKPSSRVEEMVERAILQEEEEILDPLEIAVRRGVTVITVEQAQKWIAEAQTKFPKSPKNSPSTKVVKATDLETLNCPYIKVEAEANLISPTYKVFTGGWPKLTDVGCGDPFPLKPVRPSKFLNVPSSKQVQERNKKKREALKQAPKNSGVGQPKSKNLEPSKVEDSSATCHGLKKHIHDNSEPDAKNYRSNESNQGNTNTLNSVGSKTHENVPKVKKVKSTTHSTGIRSSSSSVCKGDSGSVCDVNSERLIQKAVEIGKEHQGASEVKESQCGPELRKGIVVPRQSASRAHTQPCKDTKKVATELKTYLIDLLSHNGLSLGGKLKAVIPLKIEPPQDLEIHSILNRNNSISRVDLYVHISGSSPPVPEGSDLIAKCKFTVLPGLPLKLPAGDNLFVKLPNFTLVIPVHSIIYGLVPDKGFVNVQFRQVTEKCKISELHGKFNTSLEIILPFVNYFMDAWLSTCEDFQTSKSVDCGVLQDLSFEKIKVSSIATTESFCIKVIKESAGECEWEYYLDGNLWDVKTLQDTANVQRVKDDSLKSSAKKNLKVQTSPEGSKGDPGITTCKQNTPESGSDRVFKKPQGVPIPYKRGNKRKCSSTEEPGRKNSKYKEEKKDIFGYKRTYCEVCGISITNLDEHIRGKTHQENYSKASSSAEFLEDLAETNLDYFFSK